MTEETDAPEGGAEGVEPSAVDENSAATTEQTTGTEESGQADDTGDATEEPTKRVPWFQKRIDEVTAQKYEAQREADYLRSQIEAYARSQIPAPQAEPTVPLEPFDEGYNEWVIAEATKRASAQLAQQLQQQQRLSSYSERESAARAALPNYDNVVKDPSLPITPLMADVIRDSASGPEIAYHLGTNRSEAQRIASLPPHRQAAELGKIEAAVTGAPQARKPIPPAPPQTVGGVSSGLTKTMDQMSYSEFVKAREAEEKNNR